MPEQEPIVVRIKRLAIHRLGEHHRTYGSYVVEVGEQTLLSGFLCECIGPGDNSNPDCGRRIAANAAGYGLATHYGRYVSQGFSDGLDPPLPGLAVGDLGRVGARVGVLIHPAHRPNLFLSSIGCLNLTGPLGADQMMNPEDSRNRVVALVGELRKRRSAAFKSHQDTQIDAARVEIVGEPQ